jgi:hypothetical protein
MKCTSHRDVVESNLQNTSMGSQVKYAKGAGNRISLTVGYWKHIDCRIGPKKMEAFE